MLILVQIAAYLIGLLTFLAGGWLVGQVLRPPERGTGRHADDEADRGP